MDTTEVKNQSLMNALLYTFLHKSWAALISSAQFSHSMWLFGAEYSLQMDNIQIGKGVRQGCILSPCLFNFCAEYIVWNAGLDESQTGIKIARRNINNLRYADDTTLMAEGEEELKSLLMKVKEESECWLKIQHSEN